MSRKKCKKCAYQDKFGLLPNTSDCKYASGISPTMIDSPTSTSVVTAKFSVREGITMLISAITRK